MPRAAGSKLTPRWPNEKPARMAGPVCLPRGRLQFRLLRQERRRSRGDCSRRTHQRERGRRGLEETLDHHRIARAIGALRAGGHLSQGYGLRRDSHRRSRISRESRPGAGPAHRGLLIRAAGGVASTPMLQMVDDRRRRLVAPIPAAQAGSMKAGQQVSFSVPAYPGQTFKAPVALIAEAMGVKSRTMPVELDVTNRDGRLAPGSFASVKWPLDRGYPTLFVPTTA